MQLAQSESQQSIASVTSDMLESPSDPEGPSLVNSEVTSPTDEAVPPVGSSPADNTTTGNNEASSPDGKQNKYDISLHVFVQVWTNPDHVIGGPGEIVTEKRWRLSTGF